MARSSLQKLLSKRGTKLLVASVCFLVVALFGYRILNSSQIEVDVGSAKNDKPVKAIVVLDGTEHIVDSDDKLFKLRIQRGDHTVVVKAAGFDNYTKNFSTTWRETEVIKPEFKPVTAESAARQVYPLEGNDYSYFGAKLYGQEQNWLMFSVLGNFDEAEALLVVAKYDPYDLTWRIVGKNYIDSYYLKDAPKELLQDLYEDS